MQWLGDIETPKCSHLPSWYIFTASSSGLKYTFTVYSLSLVLSKHFQLLFVKGEIMFCDSHIIILITIMINIRLQISANRKHPYSSGYNIKSSVKPVQSTTSPHWKKFNLFHVFSHIFHGFDILIFRVAALVTEMRFLYIVRLRQWLRHQQIPPWWERLIGNP